MSHGRDWNAVSHAATVLNIVTVTINLKQESRQDKQHFSTLHTHCADYMSSDPSKCQVVKRYVNVH